MSAPRQSSRLLIDDEPLLVLPHLAAAIGLNEALMLQQIQYWLRKAPHWHDDRPWIYNSYPEWQKQLPFWSVGTVRRTIEALEARGLLLGGNFNRAKTDRTKWYSIDYDAVDALIVDQPPPAPSGKNDRWSGKNDRPSDQLVPTIGTTCTDATDQVARVRPETTTETNAETTPLVEGVGEEPTSAPAPAPPPPPPPADNGPDADGPGAVAPGAPPLADLAVARYKARLHRRLVPALADRIRGDVATALARGQPLTARGLDYALEQAAGKRDPWEYAMQVWRAKPNGLPEGGPSGPMATDPGDAGGSAPAPVDPAAERDRMRASLAGLVRGGTGGPAP